MDHFGLGGLALEFLQGGLQRDRVRRQIFRTVLAKMGRTEEARLIFEKMLTYASHVGLYAEEIGPTGEAMGNFPQALTHLGLINAAFGLDRALDERAVY